MVIKLEEKTVLISTVFSYRQKGEQMYYKDLSRFSTKELVEELSSREGVEAKMAEPYQDMEVSVNGPAIVLVVID